MPKSIPNKIFLFYCLLIQKKNVYEYECYLWFYFYWISNQNEMSNLAWGVCIDHSEGSYFFCVSANQKLIEKEILRNCFWGPSIDYSFKVLVQMTQHMYV